MPWNDPPTHVEIPTPGNIPRARGIHSTGRFGNSLRARISLDDYEIITQMAAELGLSISMFVRWASVYTAKALKDAHDGTDNPNPVGDD